jgi:dTDP-glucose 4,6-dehydratase
MGRPESLIQFVADRPGHDRRYALDCSKIASELGWQRTMKLDEGLKQAIDWYRNNANWVAAVRGGEYRNYYEKYYQSRDRSLRAVLSGEA